MSRSEELSPFIPSATFATTHWSVVLQAGTPDSAAAAEALETLCRTYWYPLYAYVRRQGHSPEDAQDLTQHFFAELVSRKDLVRVDRSKGRFRTFLLACLKHLLAKEWRDKRTLKRGGAFQIVPLDFEGAELHYATDGSSEVMPERLFDREWAVTI